MLEAERRHHWLLQGHRAPPLVLADQALAEPQQILAKAPVALGLPDAVMGQVLQVVAGLHSVLTCR